MTTVLTSAGERAVAVPGGVLQLPGTLAWPACPSEVVLFAHGRGRGRLSPRNIAVARQLRAAGLATLLLDLLTPEEAEVGAKVFEVTLLAKRLRTATDWVVTQREVAGLVPGYFGASTGAAHLFDEPGTLEEAGRWAAEWLVEHLAMVPRWQAMWR